jgi:hypothetical protein
MKLDDVLALRPTATDSGSLRAAIHTSQATIARLKVRADELATQRGALLLSASDEDLEEREREIAESHRAADRITALIHEMQRDLISAEFREAKDGAIQSANEANEASDAFLNWWRTEYPRLASEIIEGLNLEIQAEHQREAARIAAAKVASADLPSLPKIRSAVAEIMGNPSLWGWSLYRAFQLPSVEGKVLPGHGSSEGRWYNHDLRRTDFF